MAVSDTFAYLDRLPREQQIGYLCAALTEPYVELQDAALRRLLGTGNDRPDLVVERYLDLLPALREFVAPHADALVRAAHGKLYSDSERARQHAYGVLADLGGAPALESLVAGLTDGAVRVRELVLRSLASQLRGFVQRCREQRQDPASLLKAPAWQALADAVRRYSTHRQVTFLEIVLELGAPSLPLVADVVLGGRDVLLQQMFADALAQSPTPGAAELTLALALSASAGQQALGRRVLRKRRDEPFAKHLPVALAQVGPERTADLQRLGGDLPWGDLVIPAIAWLDGAAVQRVLALVAAIDLEPALRIRLLHAGQDHGDPAVRAAAVQQWAKLRSAESVTAVTKALTAPDPRTQLAAAEAIIELDPPDKVALLTPLLGSPSMDVRRTAMREVSKVSFARYLQRFDRMDDKTQRNAARTLAKVDPLMLERLADEIAAMEPARRLKAVRIVEMLDAEQQLRAPLLDLLHDKDQRVRATAIRIVDCSGSVEAMRVLVDALSDRDRRVRANAIEALEQLGDSQFVALLVPFLDDPDNRVRANAAKALCQLGRRFEHAHVADARRTLLRMLDHEVDLMRISAAWAIGRVSFDGAAEALEARAAVESNRHVVAHLRKALDMLQRAEIGQS